jgi:hypothetical protein
LSLSDERPSSVVAYTRRRKAAISGLATPGTTKSTRSTAANPAHCPSHAWTIRPVLGLRTHHGACHSATRRLPANRTSARHTPRQRTHATTCLASLAIDLRQWARSAAHQCSSDVAVAGASRGGPPGWPVGVDRACRVCRASHSSTSRRSRVCSASAAQATAALRRAPSSAPREKKRSDPLTSATAISLGVGCTYGTDTPEKT